MGGPEVTAKLGLDVTAFKRALTASQADVGKFGSQAAAGLERSFGAHHIGKSIVGALGLGDLHQAADTIARFFVGLSKESEDAYKSLDEASSKHTEFVLEQMEKTVSAEHKYQLLLKEREKVIKNADKAPSIVGDIMGKVILGAAIVGIPGARQALQNRADEKHVMDQAAAAQAQVKADEIQAKADAAHEQADKKALDDQKENARYQKELYDDVIEADEMHNKELVKEIEYREKIAKLSEDILDAQKSLAYEQAKLNDEKQDRGRLSLRELASIPGFASGVSTDTIEKGKTAREILDIRAKAEQARQTGDVSGANEQLSKADQLAAGLQGTIKSDEANPFAAAQKTLESSEKELRKLNEKLATVVGEGA